jgi:hypothetical protein
MGYIAGYVIACFMFFVGISCLLSLVHRKSKFHVASKPFASPPRIKSRVVISLSIILPSISLSFVLLTFPSFKIALDLSQQGHLPYVAVSLLPPIGAFLIGYFHFKKAVLS